MAQDSMVLMFLQSSRSTKGEYRLPVKGWHFDLIVFSNPPVVVVFSHPPVVNDSARRWSIAIQADHHYCFRSIFCSSHLMASSLNALKICTNLIKL